MSAVPFPYEEFDPSDIATYPLESRPSKVAVKDLASVWAPSSGFDGWLASLPNLLAAGDFRAVVGAVRTPTPQLSASITAVTINPWWNVPQSIIRTTSFGAGYQVTRGPNGVVSVRQPPGPRNALGRFGLPTLIVQEGGYSLGNLRSGSHAFFRGIAEAWHD